MTLLIQDLVRDDKKRKLYPMVMLNSVQHLFFSNAITFYSVRLY